MAAFQDYLSALAIDQSSETHTLRPRSRHTRHHQAIDDPTTAFGGHSERPNFETKRYDIGRITKAYFFGNADTALLEIFRDLSSSDHSKLVEKKVADIESSLGDIDSVISESHHLQDDDQTRSIRKQIKVNIQKINDQARSMEALKKEERKQWFENEGEEKVIQLVRQLRENIEALEAAGIAHQYSNDWIAQIEQRILNALDVSELSDRTIMDPDLEPVFWTKLKGLLHNLGMPDSEIDRQKDNIISLFKENQGRIATENRAALYAAMREEQRRAMEAPIPIEEIQRLQRLRRLQISNQQTAVPEEEELTAELQEILLDDLESKGAGAVLPLAVKQGRKDGARFLLENRVDPNAKDSEEWAALHYAARNGDLGTVQRLIQHKADLNIRNADQWTPIYTAVVHMKEEVVRELLKYGVDIRLPSKDGSIPLHEAAISGSVELAQALHTYDSSLINERNQWGNTSLAVAVLHCQPSTIRYLLENGAVVDPVEQGTRMTPLHKACNYGHLRTVQILLEHGASLASKDSKEYTPFLRAAHKGRAKVVEYLLEKHHVDLEGKDEDSNRAIHLAIYRGSSETVKVLTGHGAKVNVRGRGGLSPLHIACLQGHLEIVKHLLDPAIGAVITARDIEGMTPLMQAADKGCLDIVNYLLSRNAAVTETNDDEYTALHRAAMRNHYEVMKVLVAAGAELEAQTIQDWTPLHIAASCGAMMAVEALLDLGSNVAALDIRGHNTATLARMYGHEQTAAVLESHLLASMPVNGNHLPNDLQNKIDVILTSSSDTVSKITSKSLNGSLNKKASTENIEEKTKLRQAPRLHRKQQLRRVKFDFDPEDECGSELCVLEGDIVVVLREDNEMKEKGWCKVRIKGERQPGLVPLEYLENHEG